MKEFGLTIEEMKSEKCSQPFIFSLSRRYLSESLIKLPVLVTRLDGKENILTIQTYLVDTKVPFICGKRTLEEWNFKIDSQDKVLEIKSRTDGPRMRLKIIDTAGGHYAIVLETKKKQNSNILYLEDTDLNILFLEDEEGDRCSFKAVSQE